MMQQYGWMVGRTILAFIILILISRTLGKQTISNMTFHDFATGISVGAIAANLAFNYEMKALYLIACLAVLTAISFFSSWVSLRFPRTRHWIAGAPTVIIEKGKILEANMRKIHYTMDSLNQSLRENDVFNLDEVEFAILETNGQLSVKNRDPFLSVTKQDLKLPTKLSNVPIELIMDGIIMQNNLKDNQIPEEWLLKQIKKRDKNLSDIYYAVKTTTGMLVFDYYKDQINKPIDKE